MAIWHSINRKCDVCKTVSLVVKMGQNGLPIYVHTVAGDLIEAVCPLPHCKGLLIITREQWHFDKTINTAL